jgi:hypothetical protein
MSIVVALCDEQSAVAKNQPGGNPDGFLTFDF